MSGNLFSARVKRFRNSFFPLLFVALVLLFGCSTANFSSINSNTAFASPTELTTVLTNGNNAMLHWKNNATADSGVWIEYTTLGYDWIQLDAFPSDENVNEFLHANLAPRTRFLYRLQPFFGRPTKTLEITTGNSTNGATSFSDGPISPTNNISTGKKFSVRSLKTFVKAAPADLTATLSSPTSVDLHWRNHAADEDGYLLEISAHPKSDFAPCALLPANATSFRKTHLPPKTKIYFRVRAFFYGKPSDVCQVDS